MPDPAGTGDGTAENTVLASGWGTDITINVPSVNINIQAGIPTAGGFLQVNPPNININIQTGVPSIYAKGRTQWEYEDKPSTDWSSPNKPSTDWSSPNKPTTTWEHKDKL